MPVRAVHLFAVGARGKTRDLRKRPVAGEIRVVAFVQLVAGNAQRDVLFLAVIREDLARFGVEQVGRQAAPNVVIARMRVEQLVNRRIGMR